MRSTKNVSITIPIGMLKETERLAKLEHRTMSELFREALRQYNVRHSRTPKHEPSVTLRTLQQANKHPMSPEDLGAEDKRLRQYGARQAKKLGIREQDVVRIIHESRARRTP